MKEIEESLKEYIALIKEKYPIRIYTLNTEMNAFEKGCLYKKANDNKYCFITKLDDSIISTTFFYSDNSKFSDIERDYFISPVDFYFSNIERFKTVLDCAC